MRTKMKTTKSSISGSSDGSRVADAPGWRSARRKPAMANPTIEEIQRAEKHRDAETDGIVAPLLRERPEMAGNGKQLGARREPHGRDALSGHPEIRAQRMARGALAGQCREAAIDFRQSCTVVVLY